MKITIFNGSPRGEKGNTNVMAVGFADGAVSAGAQVENICLSEYEIKHCTACGSCSFKTPGKCVIKDDMADLLEKFGDSDVVVFATPLYVDNVSGMMKVFMDRMMPLLDPLLDTDSDGKCVHKLRITPPKIIAMSNCGYPEHENFQVLSLLFKRIARNMNSEVIAEIYRGEGVILNQKSMLLNMLISKYKKLLKKCGQEIVQDGRLSAETIASLEKPLVPAEIYIKEGNKHMAKMLEN